ncbi:MAG TPA: helix-turn-helix transcriptional regulator [Nitrospira sp.]|nr:helix-turn-helix transcriptional regulator [Nitrospira sp.]
MATPQKQFGAQVRKLRVKRGWSQEELAQRAGRHWTYIGGIERGERNVTLQVIADLARALGVQVKSFFPSEDDR